jgi:hypothetical protein
LKLHKDTIESISILTLYISSLNMDVRLELHRTIDSFIMRSSSFADMVFDEVKKIAMADCLLVHRRPEPKKTNPSKRSVQVDLGESFRREPVAQPTRCPAL